MNNNKNNQQLLKLFEEKKYILLKYLKQQYNITEENKIELLIIKKQFLFDGVYFKYPTPIISGYCKINFKEFKKFYFRIDLENNTLISFIKNPSKEMIDKEFIYISPEEALSYFKSLRLIYENITLQDIKVLINQINYNLHDNNKEKCISISDEIFDVKIKNNIFKSCSLYLQGKDIDNKEAISFYSKNEIFFATWNDGEIKHKVISAFIDWCDHLSSHKKYIPEVIKYNYNLVKSILK